MNSGQLLIQLSFVTAALAAGFFLRTLGGRRGAGAAAVFTLHAALVVAAFTVLCSHFLGHRFEYAYVAQYSSRSLSPMLALSAVWAGQEGSVLLWVALAALLGLMLMRQPGSLAKPALFFVSLAQAALLVLLLIKSPFARSAVVPHDGHGLNPLLEDPWMVVHPPVLFLGYAALLIPFALAAATLLSGQVREWTRMVWPWALFVVLTLGTGIALGGVWAYKVLGWGGYWGWDPVENASLVPWLVAVALLHGLLIQRTTGALARTNLLLACLGWSTVLGGTYLTRSGVLQNFSVHSFADSGLNTPLLAILLLFTLLAAGMLMARWRGIERSAMGGTAMSRESTLWLGMIAVLILAALVTVGTAAPLLTTLFGKPAGVQPAFYHGVSVPIGVALVVLMGLSPALRWYHQRGLSWFSGMVPGLAVSALVVAPSAFAGMRDPGYLALIAVAGLALGVNVAVAVRLFKRGWMYGAGHVGHAGVAVMVLGMALSASLGKSQKLQLPHGQAVESLGYRLTYEGDRDGTRGDRTLAIKIEAKNWSMEARPALLPSPQGEGVIRKPAIDGRREIYLSPLEVRKAEPATGNATWITQGEAVEVAGTRYRFVGFRMESAPEFRVLADLDVSHAGLEFHVSPAIASGAGGSHSIPTQVPGVGALSLVRIDADNHRVALLLPASVSAAGTAIVEFSTKPFINLVWIGALLVFTGLGLAGIRRAVEVAHRKGGPS